MNVDQALAEFGRLKVENQNRNQLYYELRMAAKGNFRWPRNWPAHVDKVTYNMCKPIVERFSTYLMGKGFTFNVDRPNTLEMRHAAERTEKILRRLLELSNADIQFMEGAKDGSKLGRTIYKVYKQGAKGAEHACFSKCVPDFFYGIPVGPHAPGQFSTVYYSYPLDKLEAELRFPGHSGFKSEAEIAEANRYSPKADTRITAEEAQRRRRIPVLEVWTKTEYLLIVGGVTVYNGKNPFSRKGTNEGYVPFVVIENIRDDESGFGEADIAQARVLNERLNYLISRREHIVNRWLTPTIVWEGAPQNYGDILTSAINGGGAIPTRLGSRLYFLSYDRDNQAVSAQITSHMQAILDTSGMNAAALSGLVQGAINTGPSLSVQFQPVLSTIEKKRGEWTVGLKALFSMLLEVQESIGDSTALGEAVINQQAKTQQLDVSTPEDPGADFNPAGVLVSLSGKDIAGLRDVTINWPGMLPKDTFQESAQVMDRVQRGQLSMYTGLEMMGVEYPDDEIARIRQENEDPALRGEKVAEQMRSAMPMLKQGMAQDHEMQMAAMQQAQQQQEAPPPDAPPSGNEPSPLADRIRAANARPALDTESGDFPVFSSQGY